MKKLLITLLCSALMHCGITTAQEQSMVVAEGDPFPIVLPIEKEGESWEAVNAEGAIKLLNDITKLSGKLKDGEDRIRHQIFTHTLTKPMTTEQEYLFFVRRDALGNRIGHTEIKVKHDKLQKAASAA